MDDETQLPKVGSALPASGGGTVHRRRLENVPHRSYRFATGISVELHMAGASYALGAENLTRPGILPGGSPPTAFEGRVDISLRLPGGGRTIRIPGRIVRDQLEDSTGKRRIGVAFLEPNPAQAADLEALVARLLEARVPA